MLIQYEYIYESETTYITIFYIYAFMNQRVTL